MMASFLSWTTCSCFLSSFSAFPLCFCLAIFSISLLYQCYSLFYRSLCLQQLCFCAAQLFDACRLVIVNTSGENRRRTQQHAGHGQISPLFFHNKTC